MDKRIRCNECGVKSCNSYDNLRVALGCRMFAPLSRLNTPMLFHLMQEEKSVNTTKVLDQFNVQIEEVGRYPYFRLSWR